MVKRNKEHRKFHHYGLQQGYWLRPGGVLEYIDWVYDEEAGEGNYVAINRTDRAHWCLFNPVNLDPGIRLKDIFLLLAQCPELIEVERSNWAEEYVEEALKVTPDHYSGEYNPEGIEYLELKMHMELNSTTKELETNLRLDFHGIGFERREDKFFEWKNEDDTPAIEWPKGSRTPWAIEFTPLEELLDIPLKINPNVVITEADHEVWKARWDAGERGPLHEWKIAWGFTLGQVVDGVLWELSFCGGPKKKSEEREKLYDTAAEVEEAIAAGDDTVFKPLSELIDDLDKED